MLIALHLSLAWGIEAWWARAFLLAHYGLFLLWQPFLRAEKQLHPVHASLILLGGVGLMISTSWWVIGLWLALQAGLVGGNVPSMESRKQRLAYLLALLYLLSMLLLWVAPQIFGVGQDNILVGYLVQYGLIVLPGIIVLVKVETRQRDTPYAVDLFYGLMLFLLVMVLVLGSFTLMATTHQNYTLALIESSLGIAAVLVVLSLLWNPRAGFAGFGQLLSRYLLSVGLPFEQWLQNLAALADRESDASAFLRQALSELAQLPWLKGIKWNSPDGDGALGEETKNVAEFSFHGLSLVLYARWALSPALMMHLKLLTQLLGYFYEAKRREQTLRHNAYTQAIYETGARLTHDVKNLLQSMKNLCAVAESSDPDRAAELQALMQRQLPQITQRLQRTMEKLQAPQQTETGQMAANAWWDNFQQRYVNEDIEFRAEQIGSDKVLPFELFDSVADNLIQNALHKKQLQRNIKLSVHFTCDNPISLTVCDSGTAMKSATARQLFEAPVPSQTGLGIGLYQAARQAQQHGYQLQLESNRDGSVCFKLSKSG